jgi:hypothetical protein
MPKKEILGLWSLSDLRTPWCLFVAATLRIADLIAAGSNRIDELADAAGSDAYALHRVLTTLVEKGVFEEPEPGVFRLNETARQLLDPSQRLGLDLNGIGGRMAHAWGTLLEYVQAGKPAYESVFGLPFWEDLKAHPNVQASFDALMGPSGHGTPNPDFQITGDWESVRSVVDVGGGSGAMLAEILRKRPTLRGVLVDYPRTVALSAETFRAAGVAERVTTVGQSFFDPLPGGAELYLLRKVINDWPDREAKAILQRCAEAARPNGRVVVLSGVLPDNTPRPLTIEMVLLGGKSRSVSEFRELARAAGLEVLVAGQQPSGYFVVECRPN